MRKRHREGVCREARLYEDTGSRQPSACQGRASRRNHSCQHFISDVQPPGLWDKTFLLSQSVCGTWLRRSEQTATVIGKTACVCVRVCAYALILVHLRQHLNAWVGHGTLDPRCPETDIQVQCQMGRSGSMGPSLLRWPVCLKDHIGWMEGSGSWSHGHGTLQPIKYKCRSQAHRNRLY